MTAPRKTTGRDKRFHLHNESIFGKDDILMAKRLRKMLHTMPPDDASKIAIFRHAPSKYLIHWEYRGGARGIGLDSLQKASLAMYIASNWNKTIASYDIPAAWLVNDK